MAEERHTEVLEARLEADTSKWARNLNKAQKQLKGFGKGIAKFGGAITGASAGVAAFGAASVKMALQVEKSFAEVRTLLPDISDEAFGQLTKDVQNLQREFGIVSDDAIPALYQAISASVPPDNVVSFMETATKASIAGVTDLETAVDGITSVVNAYGAETISAAQASDIMFTAVKLGKTNFDQLSRSLFNVVPTAKSVNVGFEQIGAAMAAMTAQGVPTKIATTQLRALFVELSKDTDLSAAVMAKFGKSFADLTAEGMDFAEIMQAVRDSMPEDEFRKLFSSVEAQGAALNTTGDAFERYNKALAEAKDSAGATETAFETMNDTVSMRLQKAMNAFNLSLINLGTLLLPTVESVLIAITPYIDAMTTAIGSLNPEMVDLGVKVIAGAFAFGALLVALGGVAIFVNSAITAFAGIKAAISGIGIAIGAVVGTISLPIVLIVGALVAAGVAAWYWRDELVAAAKSVGEWYTNTLKPQIGEAMIGVRMAMLSAKTNIVMAWESIKGAGATVAAAWARFTAAMVQEIIWLRVRVGFAWYQVTQAFTTARDTIVPIMQRIGRGIGRILLPPFRLLRVVVVFVFNVIKNTIVSAWDFIRPILVTQWRDAFANMRMHLTKTKNDAISAWARIYGIIQAAWRIIQPIIGPQWAFAMEEWGKIADKASQAFSAAWGWVMATAMLVWQWFDTTFLPGWTDMLNTLTSIFEGAEPTLSGLWTAIQQSAQVVSAWFSATFLTQWQSVVNAVTQELIWMRVRFGILWFQIQTTIYEVWNAVNVFWQSTWGLIVSTAQEKLALLRQGILLSWLVVKMETMQTWTAINAAIAAAWVAITSTTANYLNVFKHKLRVAWLGMRIATRLAWNRIRNALDAAWAAIVRSVTGWYTDMRTKFLSQDWGGVGRGIINGIKSGITAAAGALGSAARAAASNALNSVKSFLGMQSPSMVAAMEIGRPFMEGIALGIRDAQSVVDSQLASSLGRNVGGGVELGATVGDLLGDGGVGGGITLQQIFNGPADADEVGAAAYDGVGDAQRALGVA